MEYRDICDHYYSALTYTYALDDAYKVLLHDVERADLIYQKYSNFGYKSIIELSAKFITYLELFVGSRWCFRGIFGSPIDNSKGLIGDSDMRDSFHLLEERMPLIDGIWWCLRNEIHHSKLPKIRPVISTRMTAKGNSADFRGHLVPTPTKYEKWINEEEIKAYFFGEEQPTFAKALADHYAAILNLNELSLNLLVSKCEQQFGKGIEFSI